MSVPVGARLWPYEIISAIGAGGMGEVYRARDSRLGRDVAIKVLPSMFTADPERLARFEREAREPDWQALPVSFPSSIRRVLQRCLEKDER